MKIKFQFLKRRKVNSLYEVNLRFSTISFSQNFGEAKLMSTKILERVDQKKTFNAGDVTIMGNIITFFLKKKIMIQ